jgi:hypothetical protein
MQLAIISLSFILPHQVGFLCAIAYAVYGYLLQERLM